MWMGAFRVSVACNVQWLTATRTATADFLLVNTWFSLAYGGI